ncbi:MAG: Rid family detoxifying hydrolase [Gammaproteobacteria bacterium]
MPKTAINAPDAPQAIGAYSHAARAGNLVFISGQIPLCPQNGEIVAGGAAAQVARAFANLAAVCKAAGGGLDDIVKLTVYLTDLGDFALVNAEMEKLFSRPFPARAALGVAALPKGARVEVEAVLQTGAA